MDSLVIQRPLFFLCGPWIDVNNEDDLKKASKIDRRLILSNYISSRKIIDKIYPLPIIVDELFKDSKEIKKFSLNTGLLEEIVSSISCKTYIFLDTMSTSFELGLFTNSKQKSNVKILLDNDYSIRTNCKVGDYITKSQDDFIKYPARYEKDNNFIFFKDDTIPEEISQDIDSTILDLLDKVDNPIVFTNDFSQKEQTGLIRYQIIGKKIVFNTDLKTIFYLSGDKYLGSIEENIDFDVETLELKKYVLDKIIITFVKKNVNHVIYDMIFDNEWVFELSVDNYTIDDIIRNLFYIIYVMKTKRLTINNNSVKMPFVNCKKCTKYNKLNQYDFWNLNKKNIDIINKYLNNQEKFLNSFELYTKGKKRKIFSYANTNYGKKLRMLHNSFNSVLDYLPISRFAFAYVQNRNPKTCIQEHIDSSYFLKMDISKFFESIRITRLTEFIRRWQIEQCDKFVKEHSKYRKYQAIFDFNDIIPLKKILASMMVKNSLILGFVTSPKLSNFYLYGIDLKISEEAKKYNLIYTRYADDILISSEKKFDNVIVTNYITSLLNEIKLNTNTDKTRKYSLNNDGDTIKFLGLLIKNSNGNRSITISNSYLMKIVGLIDRNHSSFEFKEHIYGMIMYVKNISQKAYEKLTKLVKVKLNLDLDNYIVFLKKN